MTATENRGRWSWTALTSRRDPADGTWFEWCVLLAWLAVTITVAAHHEPWRDEADPWLYVRDADLRTIVARTAYAGFPALWFLILAPLAKGGLPYWSQQVLHLAIAAGSVSLLLWRGPFSRVTRLLFSFSLYLLFEYAIVVRSYALSVLLLFAAAALHRKRLDRPILYAFIIALLCNTNTHGLFIAGVLGGIQFLDLVRRRKPDAGSILSLVIMVVGAALAYAQLRRPPDVLFQSVIRWYDPMALVFAVGNAFLPMTPIVLAFSIGMVLLIAITFAIRRTPEAQMFLWASIAGLTFIFVFVWAGGYRHFGYIFLVAVVALWISAERDQTAVASRGLAGIRATTAVLLNVSLLASVYAGFWWSVNDIRNGFSASREMADFIKSHDLVRYDIAAHKASQTAAILPYLPGKKFWFAGIGEYGSYMKWDLPYERMLFVPYPAAERIARAHFGGRPYLLLFNAEMPNPERHGYRLLYRTRTRLFTNADEEFWLYQPIR